MIIVISPVFAGFFVRGFLDPYDQLQPGELPNVTEHIVSEKDSFCIIA